MALRLLIVDALNLIRRVHAASPAGEDALKSMLQSLHRALRESSPSHAVAVFDGEGPTWRHRLYPEYKAGRPPMPEELRGELGLYRKRFGELGIGAVDKPELEADDVVATLAVKTSASGGQAVILSTDTVFCQLLSASISVRDHFGKRELDRSYVTAKFGVPPERLVDLWALAGNPTTHIPGVPRVGVKTAAKLLDEHGDLERVLEAAPRIAGKLGQALAEHAERARLSRRLARLRTDLELGWNLKSFQWTPPR